MWAGHHLSLDELQRGRWLRVRPVTVQPNQYASTACSSGQHSYCSNCSKDFVSKSHLAPLNWQCACEKYKEGVAGGVPKVLAEHIRKWRSEGSHNALSSRASLVHFSLSSLLMLSLRCPSLISSLFLLPPSFCPSRVCVCALCMLQVPP